MDNEISSAFQRHFALASFTIQNGMHLMVSNKYNFISPAIGLTANTNVIFLLLPKLKNFFLIFFLHFE